MKVDLTGRKSHTGWESVYYIHPEFDSLGSDSIVILACFPSVFAYICLGNMAWALTRPRELVPAVGTDFTIMQICRRCNPDTSYPDKVSIPGFKPLMGPREHGLDLMLIGCRHAVPCILRNPIFIALSH